MPDTGDVHGALLALTELAAAMRDSSYPQLEPERRKASFSPPARSMFTLTPEQVFAYLSTVPLATIQSPRQEDITEAACRFIAAGISLPETQHAQSSVPHWRRVVDSGLRSKSAAVQEAAAAALAAVSRLVDCSAVVDRLIGEFAAGSAPMQQSLARVLGVLDYASHPHGIESAVRCLLGMVDRTVRWALVPLLGSGKGVEGADKALCGVTCRMEARMSRLGETPLCLCRRSSRTSRAAWLSVGVSLASVRSASADM